MSAPIEILDYGRIQAMLKRDTEIYEAMAEGMCSAIMLEGRNTTRIMGNPRLITHQGNPHNSYVIKQGDNDATLVRAFARPSDSNDKLSKLIIDVHVDSEAVFHCISPAVIEAATKYQHTQKVNLITMF